MKKVHVHVSTLKFSCVINFFDKLKNLTALPIYSCTFTLVVEVVKHILFCCMLSTHSKKSLGSNKDMSFISVSQIVYPPITNFAV